MPASRLALALLVVTTSIAYADPKLVALVPATDARDSVALGPSGQVYLPDGLGGWVRRDPGGTASDIVATPRVAIDDPKPSLVAKVAAPLAAKASTPPDTVGAAVIDAQPSAPTARAIKLPLIIAGVANAAPFKRDGDNWSRIDVGLKAKARLGKGTRPTAIVGRAIFALDNGTPTKLAVAPDKILALAASKSGVLIQTPKGLQRFELATWKQLPNQPANIVELVTDRFVRTTDGLVDLKTNKKLSWPSGILISAVFALPNDTLYAAATNGDALELLTIRAGKLLREPVSLDSPGEPADLVADAKGRVVIALRDGRVASRDTDGTWTSATVRDELPAAKPGPAPARLP